MLEDVLDLPSVKRPRVFELGCAPGTMLVRMARLRPRNTYHGLDYSAAGLEVCRSYLQRVGVQSSLFWGDYWDFQPDEKYDLTVSFGVIEHATNPAAAIARHATFVRPDGYVAVSIPNYGHRTARWLATRIDPRVFDTHNVAIMDPEALEHAMSSAGLTDVRVQASGVPKVRTTCPDRTASRLAWRSVAKLWNASARLLPPGMPWYTTYWAAGRVPR